MDCDKLVRQMRFEQGRQYRGGIYGITSRMLAYNSNRIEGGRLILFRECLRNNITPFVVRDINRLEYIRCLREAQTNNNVGPLSHLFSLEQEHYKSVASKFII